jgi:hypothetical protein
VAANDGSIDLQLGNPVMNKSTFSSHHAYPITGKDSLGNVDCHRRYSHFHMFAETLIRRFPGLYVPPIPPKQSNKTEERVAQERQYFLDLFLKKCCELSYIAQSSEMQSFLRPTGNIEK